MAELARGFKGLNVTNRQIEGFMADFSGYVNLEKLVSDTLTKLSLSNSVQSGVRLVKGGHMSMGDFDGWFAEIVNLELRNAIGVLRNKAIQKALAIGAHDAAYAVSRRTYKEGFTANINIAGHRGRISSRRRIVEPPSGGKSGIHRPRTVKDRTKTIREYYGPDRDFLLRIFSEGRDVFMATPEGPTGRGSGATYGRRGAMAPRWNFVHSMQSDMQQAAQQLGINLTGYVEKWLDTKFKEE